MPSEATPLASRAEASDATPDITAEREEHGGRSRAPIHNPVGILNANVSAFGHRMVAGIAAIPELPKEQDREPWNGAVAQFDAFAAGRAHAAEETTSRTIATTVAAAAEVRTAIHAGHDIVSRIASVQLVGPQHDRF
ncbi:hypothetical protein Caci_3934 [Catenulispora acidiphila DSM 44928]|uniref:Uncharacterized protein n=1 Tax=Catenulispora acidiphila (strain DSM 44928 / JCM 14897 / NBRC 102108 / NRRL B-24433 / ID139908) TaxID=479433 RepID=C7QEP7_CATAD|nr:hypothetical protein [Catenulispora acidiphila]ACU72817.1 hypothetical protein Caci_3934 [Catenulispora acidiphila DSM 44928]